MSTVQHSKFQSPPEPHTADTTVPTQPGLPPTNPDATLDTEPSAYLSYLEIRQQIEAFEKLADKDQAIAITLSGYPFFTETRLKAIYVHQSGTVSIIGEAKGGKAVSVRETVASLSFALSLMSRPAHTGAGQDIEVGFISSI